MSFPDTVAAATYAASVVARMDEGDRMRQLSVAWIIGCLIGVGVGITDVAQAREMRRQLAILIGASESDLDATEPIIQALLEAVR